MLVRFSRASVTVLERTIVHTRVQHTLAAGWAGPERDKENWYTMKTDSATMMESGRPIR